MTMTKREYHEAVIKANINDELTAQAKAYIEAIDKANVKRKDAKNKAQAEVDEVVIAVLTEEPAKAKAISDACVAYAKANEIDMTFSTSKVVASCKRLEAEGKVAITEERKGSRITNSYALVTDEA